MAEYIMFEDCGKNHSNTQIEVEAYNAVQDTLEDKLGDINMDKENQLCEVFYKTHTLHKAIGAQHNSRLYQYDIQTKHKFRTGQHLYDESSILSPCSWYKGQRTAGKHLTGTDDKQKDNRNVTHTDYIPKHNQHTYIRNLSAQMNRERRSEHAKTKNLSKGTDGNELVDDKCE
eukprot:2180621-Heterocapsa_arctica.AAC.1